MLFDTHAHYYDNQFDEDRRESIERAFSNGVKYILNASSDVASSIENISMSQEYENVYAAVGMHPHNIIDINNNIISAIADFASYPKVVAIGEIGLDYFYDNSPREAQKMGFVKQIYLAINMNLPVIVHDRDAHEDTLNIIKSENAKKVGGIFHCFSGSVEMAREVLNNNFYISIGGPVTYKNANKLLEVVKYVPEDRLLLETDCPYLPPEPLRGKRNESANVKLVAEKVAKIRGKTLEYISDITTSNALKLFGIS